MEIKKDKTLIEEEDFSNLNVILEGEVFRRAKAKAAILGIKISEYISRLIDDNTLSLEQRGKK